MSRLMKERTPRAVRLGVSPTPREEPRTPLVSSHPARRHARALLEALATRPPEGFHPFTSYGLALGILLIAIVFRLWLGRVCGLTAPFVTLYPAIIMVAALCGPGPGVLATILGAISAAYWFLPPYGIAIATIGDLIALMLFVSSGLLMSAVADRLRRARWAQAVGHALKAANEQLERKVAERTTELRAAHHSLAEKARDFEAFFENTLTPLVFLDPEFNFIRVNNAYAAAGRREVAEFPGHNHFEFYPHAENEAIFRDVVRRKTPYMAVAKAFEFPDHPEWGVTYWDWTLVPILNADGEVAFLVYSLEDVTLRKRAEIELEKYSRDLEELVRRRTDQLEAANAHLRDSEARMSGVVGTAVDGIITIDQEGTIETVNTAVERIFGYAREELVGHSVGLLMPEPARSEHKAHVQGYLQTGERRIIGTGREVVAQRKDGSAFSAELSISEVMLGDRRLFTGIVRDITERKRAEANERLATQVLRTLNRGTGDLQFMMNEVLRAMVDATGLDAAGLRMREANDCPYYAQAGFSNEFLAHENFLAAQHTDGSIVCDADGRPVLECTCGLVLSGRTDPTMPCFTPGGSFWTNRSTELLALPREADPRTNPRNHCIHAGYQSVALIPVRSGDEIIGLLQLNGRREGCFTLESIRFFESLADNIGLGLQRKRSEEALAVAKTSAEQANAAKDHFLAVLSHELRTPLAPVLMTASSLETDHNVPAWIREDMSLIRRSVDLEVRLIDDLLDINRISRGKLQLRNEEVDLHSKLAAALEICRMEAQEKGLVVETDLEARESRVQGDPARVQQVFWNLLKNAIKFTPRGGHITVRTSNTDGHCRIEVIDTGIGIASEALPALFDAFEQGGTQITRQFGGLGLGLAITRGLVQMHGGRVAAKSPGPGQGATFIVEFPVIRCETETLARAVTPKRSKRVQLRILLVEDNEPTAQVLQRLLAKAGHEVIRGASVQEGLTLANSNAIDMVVSDLGLPDGTGHDLMETLRSSRPDLKGIALSGYGMETDVERSRRAGFREHLTKPVDMETLLQAIARLVPSTTP